MNDGSGCFDVLRKMERTFVPALYGLAAIPERNAHQRRGGGATPKRKAPVTACPFYRISNESEPID